MLYPVNLFGQCYCCQGNDQLARGNKWCGLNRTISHINNHLINILSLQINDEVACKDSSSW